MSIAVFINRSLLDPHTNTANKKGRAMLHEQLEEQYRDCKTTQITVTLFENLLKQVDAFSKEHNWSRDEAISALLAAGLHTIRGWVTTEPEKPLDQMSEEELRRFKDARLSQLEARYSVLNFQSYQLWQENQAQDQNLCGLMPQFEAAVNRLHRLEDEVRRLRALVPESARHSAAAPLVTDAVPSASSEEPANLSARLRAIFGNKKS
jgi:hypothetical protein